jgi:hypothetical protein
VVVERQHQRIVHRLCFNPGAPSLPTVHDPVKPYCSSSWSGSRHTGGSEEVSLSNTKELSRGRGYWSPPMQNDVGVPWLLGLRIGVEPVGTRRRVMRHRTACFLPPATGSHRLCFVY